MAGSVAVPAASIDQTRALRLALGVTLSVALAYAIAWPISFLTTVLVAKFLSAPTPRPSLKAGLGIIVSLALASLAGMLLVWTVVPFMVVCLLLIGLGLFWIFLLNARGVSPFLIVMLTIGVTLLPMLALNSPALAGQVALGLVFGGAVSVLIVWLAFVLVPDPSGATSDIVPEQLPEKSFSVQLHYATVSTLIVMPLVVVFYMLNFSGAALMMVFVAIMAQQPQLKSTVVGGVMMVLGNTFGGLVAIIVYNLLVAVPSFAFLLLVVLLFSLLFAQLIFSGHKLAAVYASAFTTMLVLLGSSTGTFGKEADVNFYLRILQIIMASVYMTGAASLVHHLLPEND